jgi:hypothetical protein
MSLVFIVIPVALGYPALLGAAVAVASASGFTLIEQAAGLLSKTSEKAASCEEIEMESSAELADLLQAEGSFTLQKDDLEITFVKSQESGKVKMIVTGSEARPHEELQAIGRKVLDDIMQRYAYDRLMKELKDKGFQVAQESVESDGTIRFTVRKW